MARILELDDYIESGGVQTLEDKFFDTKKNLEDIRLVKLPAVKLWWNPTTLNLRNGGIGYVIPSFYDIPKVAGHIDNDSDRIRINVDPKYDVPTGDIADRVVGYLNEAIGYVSRLNIIENRMFLTNEGDEEKERSYDGPEENESEYEKFFRTLVDKSEKINVTRINGKFGNCLGLEMPSGFIIAYNPGYGKAVYVATELDSLFYDRPTLKEGGDVFAYKRVIGKENKWEERLLKLVD